MSSSARVANFQGSEGLLLNIHSDELTPAPAPEAERDGAKPPHVSHATHENLFSTGQNVTARKVATIYFAGHKVQWRRDIRNRDSRHEGVLTHDWHRHGWQDNFPIVLWDNETEPIKELPECVEPIGPVPAAVVPAAFRNAWDEYRPKGRAG